MNHTQTNPHQDPADILRLQGVDIEYSTRAGAMKAVVDFSLTVREGDAVGIVGESGSGKSTVAMAIMRYLGGNGAITSGKIYFQGKDMATLSDEELRQIRGRDIAMVYQEPFSALNPSMTVEQQLCEIPVTHQHISKKLAREKALAILEDVKLPDPERILSCYPHQISGGQQQRVVIAMALLSSPKMLIMDEPTTALDVTVQAGIVRLVRELQRKYNMALIYISHNLGLILETCKEVCVMYAGQIVEFGPVEKVFDNPTHFYTQGLFGCIPLPHVDKNTNPVVPIKGQLPLRNELPTGCYFAPRCNAFQAGLCDQEGIIPLDSIAARHWVRCRRWQDEQAHAQAQQMSHHGGAQTSVEASDPTANQENDVILNINELEKRYKIPDRGIKGVFGGSSGREVHANNHISFDVHKGETVAIVGESGCGKSTLAKVLVGLETATDGAITFKERSIESTGVKQRDSQQIAAMQLVFQNPSDTLNPSHSISSQISRVIRKFTEHKSKKEVRSRVEELLQRVRLPADYYNRKPRQLSGGEKQRVGIARAFAANPSLVLADEPVSALDVSVAASVIELLLEIQKSNNTSMLFISHDLSVVQYLADRIVVMYLGNIVEKGTTEEIFSPPYHPYTEALLSAVPIADVHFKKREIVLEGNLPSAMERIQGCPFASRCPRKIGEICDKELPPQRVTDTGHTVACHHELAVLSEVEPIIRQNENHLPKQSKSAKALT